MSGIRRISWQQLSIEFVVGVFFFIALVILAWFTVVLSREQLFSEGMVREVLFPSVAGLAEGDSVLVRGVEMGRVEDIDLGPEHVHVFIRLNEPIAFRKGYTVDVRYSSVLGGRHVAVDQGDPGAPELPQEMVLYGQKPADIMSDTAKLIQEFQSEVQRLTRRLDEEQLLAKVSSLLAEARGVLTQIQQGKGTIGKLINDPTLYDEAVATVASLRKAGDSVQGAAAELNVVLADVRQGKGTLGKLLTDETLYTDAQTVIARLRAGEGTVGKLLTDEALYKDLQRLTGELSAMAERLAAGESTLGRLISDNGELYKSLQQTAANAEAISEGLRAGEGTLGQLIRDPALYDDARKTLNEVRAAVESFREQAPVSTFGSLIFGAF